MPFWLAPPSRLSAPISTPAIPPFSRNQTLLSTDNHPEICENADPPISSIQLDLERMGYIEYALDGYTLET